MALFAFACLFSFGMGAVIGGLIASQPHMGWRWVQWIHAMQVFFFSSLLRCKLSQRRLTQSFRVSAMYAVLVLVIMSETRSSVILTRLARDARRVTGDNRLKARMEVERESFLNLIKIACTRPLCTCDLYGYVPLF